jgi:hypothetical protein
MARSVADMVVGAWEQALRETPAMSFESEWFPIRRISRRAWLDRQPRNVYGEVIPRITIVRNNIRRLGKPKIAPRLPE